MYLGEIGSHEDRARTQCPRLPETASRKIDSDGATSACNQLGQNGHADATPQIDDPRADGQGIQKASDPFSFAFARRTLSALLAPGARDGVIGVSNQCLPRIHLESS